MFYLQIYLRLVPEKNEIEFQTLTVLSDLERVNFM